MLGPDAGLAHEARLRPSEALLRLEGVHPHFLGAGNAGHHLGRAGVVLPSGGQPLDVADNLFVEALVYAAQVGELLGCHHEREAGRASTLEPGRDLVASEPGELVDVDDRWPGEVGTLLAAPQTVFRSWIAMLAISLAVAP